MPLSLTPFAHSTRGRLQFALGACWTALWLCGAAPSPEITTPTVPLSAPPMLSAPNPSPAPPRPQAPEPTFGVQFDMGVPDGFMAGLAYQLPFPVRLGVAVGHNAVSPGLRLGLDWLPLGESWVISAQAGHYFEGDARFLAGNRNGADDILLERVAYDFANLRTGIEVPLNAITLFATAGISYISAPVQQVEELLDPGSTGNGNTEIRVPETPILSVWLPTLQLGLRLAL